MVNIIYVDKDDNVIGAGPQSEAYAKGIIHRVCRIFLFNSKGELLIHKRAGHLKTNPGLWSDSAAGHVDEGESYLESAKRELAEEVGVSASISRKSRKCTSRSRINTNVNDS